MLTYKTPSFRTFAWAAAKQSKFVLITILEVHRTRREQGKHGHLVALLQARFAIISCVRNLAQVHSRVQGSLLGASLPKSFFKSHHVGLQCN